MNPGQLADIIGYTAAGIGTIVFLPQVIKAWRSKQTKDLSSTTYYLIATVSILWAIYGLLLKANPIIFVNIIIFVLSVFLIVLKRKYG